MENRVHQGKLRTYWTLFFTFLKVSTFTFAGGLAMLPAIENDLVEKHRLLEKDAFLEYATLAQTLPGVIAINCATLVGRATGGTLGMIAAGIGAIMPAFIFMILATILAALLPQEGRLVGAMRGVRAASAALVLSAAFSLGRRNVKGVFALIVALAAFLLIVAGKLTAPLVVLLAGAAGWGYQRIRRGRERKREHAA